MLNRLIKIPNAITMLTCVLLIFIDLPDCVGGNNQQQQQQRKRHMIGPMREGTCSDPLNNCQHICIPNPSKPNRQHRCSCRKNFYLQNDGISCNNTPDLTINYEILPGNEKENDNEDDENEITLDLSPTRIKRSTIRKKIRYSRTLRTRRPYRKATNKTKQLGDGMCKENSCLNNGLCQDMKLNDGNERKFSCFCRLGFSGPFCKEETRGVKFPRFIEKAYLAFPESTVDENSFVVKIIVKPELLVSGGLIMYKKSVNLNHFLVGIENSRFVFRFENAQERYEIIHPTQINKEKWYRLRLERAGNTGKFFVDDIPANMSPDVVTKSPSEMSQQGYSSMSSRAHFVCDYCLYLGGHPQLADLVKVNYRQFGKIEKNYIGCMRNFEVNNINIDMRRMPYYGRAVDGLAIEECKTDLCTKLQCQNNAKCVISDDFIGQCHCPIGYNGYLCDNPIRVKIPKYDGNSFSSYIGLRGTSKSSNQIYIRFKPSSRDGLIFYQGYSNDKRGDFLSIYLLDGYPYAAFDLGSGTVSLRSNRRINLDTWHTVNFRRIGRKGILEVNNNADSKPVIGFSPGAQLQLTIQQNLFIGGVDTFDHVSAFTKVQTNFRGCVQMLYVDQQPIHLINDIQESANLEPCTPHPCAEPVDKCVSGECIPDGENYFCSCRLSTFEMHCQTKTSFVHSSQPSFNGTSYLEYRKYSLLSAFTRDEFTVLFTFNFKSFPANRFIFTLIGQFPSISNKSKSPSSGSTALVDESNAAYFTLITNKNNGITMDLYYGFKNRRERITKTLLDHLHLRSDQELKISKKGNKLRFVFNGTYTVDVNISPDTHFSKNIRFQNMFIGGLNVTTLINLYPILLSSYSQSSPESLKLIRSLSFSSSVKSGIMACVPLFYINNKKVSIDQAYYGKSVSNCIP